MANPPRGMAAGIIAGIYAIDFSQPLPNAAPPLTAYAATRSGQVGYMAILAPRGWGARSRTLEALAGLAVPQILTPLAHGPTRLPSGEIGYFVICPAPPGPSLQANMRAWPEAELTEFLLKPMAAALGELQARKITHRAIRADNLFQAAPRMPVTLGCAWAAPPACHQPSWMEPPYSAMCMATGRGDGRIADDVYALGALMVMLALGVNPVEGVPEDTVLRQKLEHGSYAALVGAQRLPGTLVDLVRGMLADDPEHRPSPALLANPAAARARRIAARPARRASRPLEIDGHPVSTNRMLAYELHRAPEVATEVLRNGVVERWVRREVGDVTVAASIEEAVRSRAAEVMVGDGHADSLLITRAIALLDPAAPMVWRGMALWPDGLGPALDHALHHRPDQSDSLAEIAATQAAASWAKCLGPGQEEYIARLPAAETRHWFTGGRNETGPWRLSYYLNPLTPCESPLVGKSWVVRLQDLLPAIEAHAVTPGRTDPVLVDRQIAAFIEARRDERMDVDISRLAGSLTHGDLMSQIRLLARLQQKLSSAALPNLARLVAAAMEPMLQSFNSRSRRDRMVGQLGGLAKEGLLAPIVAMLDDASESSLDRRGLAAAEERLAEIEAILQQWAATAQHRAARSRRVGQEVADGVGLLACVVALGYAVFG